MSKTILHLGYPKTGTTYLQRRIFAQVAYKYALITPEFENLGLKIEKLKMQINNWNVPFSTHSLIGNRPLLISLEGFLFEPMRQYYQPTKLQPNFTRSLIGLSPLFSKRNSDDLHIVIYLRMQSELIHSLYVESKTYFFDSVPGIETLDGYVNAVLSPADNPQDAGWYFNYINTISEILEVFPMAKIHVRFYESLTSSPEKEIHFWSELTNELLHLVPEWDNKRSFVKQQKIADGQSLHLSFVKWKNIIAPNLKAPNRIKYYVRDTLKSIGRKEAIIVEMPEPMKSAISTHFTPLNLKLVEYGINIPAEHIKEYIATGAKK